MTEKKTGVCMKAAVVLITIIASICGHQSMEAAWSPPFQVSNTTATTPAISGGGANIAIWQRDVDATTHNIESVQFPFGGLGTVQVVDTIITGLALVSNPQIAVDTAGNAAAVWIDASGIITAAFRPANGSWGTPQPISIAAGVLPQIAISDSGKIIAVWTQGLGTVAGAGFFGGVWSAPFVIATTSFSPHVGIDSSGNALVIYNDANAVPVILKSKEISITNTVSAETSLSVAPGDAGQNDISVSPNGNAVAVWTQQSGGDQIVHAKNFVAGSGWVGTVSDLTTSGTATSPKVATDAVGDAVAVWVLNGIESATFLVGTGWLPTTSITTLTSSAPDVAMSRAGNAVAVWEDDSIAPPAIDVAILPFGGSWSAPLQLSNPGTNNTMPFVSLDINENAAVVWRDITSDAFIMASEGTNLFRPQPPSNFVGTTIKNRFLTQTDRIHKLTWTPSTEPGVVEYRIYRNGILIATIPATGPFVYKDHNRSKSITDVYVLVAVNGGGVESAPLTLTFKMNRVFQATVKLLSIHPV